MLSYKRNAFFLCISFMLLMHFSYIFPIYFSYSFRISYFVFVKLITFCMGG